MKKSTSLSLGLLIAGCVAPQVLTVTPHAYKNVDYNKVWNAAIDSLDEFGFTIAQMNKEDGYISTNMIATTNREGSFNATYGKQTGFTRVIEERAKVSIRIDKKEGSLSVKVNATVEHYMSAGIEALASNPDAKWKPAESNGLLEKRIQDKIASKIGS